MSEPTGQSKKISELNGGTTLADSDLLVFVDSTGNRTKKITFGELKTTLGVLGTIGSVGDSGGTPVLEQILLHSNIRILEDGSGVKASVSAQNGITLDHNFTQDTVGAKPVVDLTVTQPVLRSLVGVSGVNVSEVGDTLQFALDIPPGTTKTVVISQESDLPTAVGGRHPMADDTDYLFVDDLDTGTDGFLLGNNTVIRASDSSIVTLTYSGTNPMFQSVSNSNKITMIRLDAPNADLFDLSGATDYIFQFVNCSVTACDKIGTIADVLAMQINDISFEANTTDGLLFTGTNGVCLMGNNLVTQPLGTAIDLGTATFDGFSLTNNFAALGGAATFLDGAASSANMSSGALGTVINNKNISNVGTMLAGITSSDVRWEFALNEDIQDTRPDGLLSIQGNATETVITVAGTFVLVAGTWTVEETSQATGTAAGRITYNGEKDARLPITASISVAPVSGTNIEISARIAIDGVTVPGSERRGTASAGSPTSITIPWQETFSTDGFAEIFVTNEDTTSNVIVSSGVHRVN